jgi:valyl-tRNA synthetase
LRRLSATLKKTDASLSAFRFNEAVNLLYSFFWKEYCDWYLEIIKLDMKDRQNQAVMLRVLENFLAALHPFMPFITEEIWQKLPHDGDSVMTRAWPGHKDLRQDRKAEAFMEDIFAVIAAVRNIRQELDIPPQKEIPAVIAASSAAQAKSLEPLSAVIRRLARISGLGIENGYKHKPSSAAVVAGGMHVSVLLEGIVDIAAEREKLRVKMNNTSGVIRGKEAMLAKPGFADKAPREIVDKEKARLQELKEPLERYRGIYEELRK